jgi:hypothetical protein
VQPSQRLSRWTLRFDGVILILAGGSAMVAETAGHFFGVGPLAATHGSPHTIGGFEAHGFAMLIGALLLRSAALAERQLWHAVGFITHLFLGAANLLFWSSFAHHNLVAAGIITTALHVIFVVAQGICLRGSRREILLGG